MHGVVLRGLGRVCCWLLMSAVAGCATAPPTAVTAVTPATAADGPTSPDPRPGDAASSSLEELDGQFFVTCGSEAVALVASGGDHALPVGFVERPAQLRAGVRRGRQIAGAIRSSLGEVNAWLPVDRLGWYTAEGVALTDAPVYVPAGQRVCRRDGGSHDAPRVYVETQLGTDWIAHEHPARVDATREGALGWVGRLPRSSLGHLPAPRPTSGTSLGTLRAFVEGARPVILTEPNGAPLLSAQGTGGRVYVSSERDGGAWVRVGFAPYVVGFTTAAFEREAGATGGSSHFGMGGLGLSGSGQAARHRLARETMEWPLRRVASGASFVILGGQTLLTPDVSYARVGPLHNMGRHTVLLGTDDGFLLFGWLLPESLIDEPETPGSP